MKRLLIFLLSTATLAAFGQGKAFFANDSLHLVYYTPDTTLLRAVDAGLASQGVSSGLMPSGVTLLADLYVGTTSTSLSLISSTVFSATVGRWLGVNVNLLGGMPGGLPLYFQVQVRDSAYASTALSLAGGSYGGSSVIFASTPGTIISNPIYDADFPSFSTWPPGDFDMSTQTGIPGARGAIRVSLIPEPGTCVVAGLGFLGWFYRRRTQQFTQINRMPGEENSIR